MPGTRINAVFHKLGHRFQRIALGIGDDADGVPMIGNAKLSGTRFLFSPFLRRFGHFPSPGAIVNLFNHRYPQFKFEFPAACCGIGILAFRQISGIAAFHKIVTRFYYR
jgi:hypothetical protein